MGCVSSKGFTTDSDKGSWSSCISRNVSGASRSRRFRFYKEDDHAAALASSSYGELNSETYHGGFPNLGRGRYVTPHTEFEFEMFTFKSPSDSQCKMVCADAKPWMCSEERKSIPMRDKVEAGCAPVYSSLSAGDGAEIINTWELMEGLEEASRMPPSSLKQKELVDDSLRDVSSPVWKKYYMQEDAEVDMDFSFVGNAYARSMGSPFSESPRRVHVSPAGSPGNGSARWACTPPLGSSFSESSRRVYTPPMGSPFSGSSRRAHTPVSGSPFSQSARKTLSRGSLIDTEDCRSMSSIELLDASTIGLKFLVSPANSSFHPSPSIFKEGSQSARLSSEGSSSRFSPCSDDAKSPYKSPITTRQSSKKPSTESVFKSGSTRFDPSLMATFEQALKATTEAAGYGEGLHFSTEESTTMSSSTTGTHTSFDTFSDAESAPWRCRKESLWRKVMPIHEDHIGAKKHLASYDFRCPPRGEGKVVLYVTSLRGIRKTYKDCYNIRLILRGLGVPVDERDVWMHSKFRGELADILSGVPNLQVPQLFIKGRHIGGAEEVKQLHEEGVLVCLMDGLAMGMIHSACTGCGDVRFVPCFSCNGSCKVVDPEGEVLRCCRCNENGLIMCPICNI